MIKLFIKIILSLFEDIRPIINKLLSSLKLSRVWQQKVSTSRLQQIPGSGASYLKSKWSFLSVWSWYLLQSLKESPFSTPTVALMDQKATQPQCWGVCWVKVLTLCFSSLGNLTALSFSTYNFKHSHKLLTRSGRDRCIHYNREK